MEEPIRKSQWENSKVANENMILDNKIQIEMAREMIKLCDVKIAEYPEEEEIPETKKEQKV